MSEKVDKNVEKVLERALVGLKDLQREQEERQYQKHWGEIKIPFTLHEGLSNFTKYELNKIRKTLEIKGASSLKKAELIALLQERIPQYLDNIHQLWDTERLMFLTKIANNGGSIIAPNLETEQINYFRENGLIYTGTFEGKKILAIPDEIINQILTLKDNIIVRKAINRNTEWIKLTYGLLYYYGTISSNKLLEMLEEYRGETIDLLDFFKVIKNANSYRKEIYIDENGYSNFRVFDPKRVKQEHRMRKNIPYYPFTKQQLITAGEPGFVDRNKSYVQLVQFLTKNFKMSKLEADRIVEECVYATRIGDSLNNVIQFLAHQLEFDRMETVQATMDHVANLMNNTRQWFIKGYKPTELSAKEEEYMLPLPSSQLNNMDSKKSVKVGRNEPCPCGSGKKYKKCCGFGK